MSDVLKIRLLIILVITLAVLFVIFFLTGCGSMKVYWNKEIPAECNMAINADKVYYKSADKSGAVIPMEKCFKVLASCRCQEQVFGKDEQGNIKRIDRSDLMKMSHYNACMNELQ